MFWALAFALCFLLMMPHRADAATWDPQAMLEAYLRDHFPWAAVDISDFQLSAAAPANPPRSIIVEKSPPGRAVFRYEFKGRAPLLATAYVKTFDRVVMSRAAYARGHVLKRDDVYETLMESSRLPRGAVRTEDQVVGKPLLRSVVSNAPLTGVMVSETPLIRRGRKVVISIDAPGFSIKADGELVQDGAVGDSVRVINLQSKKSVTGLLVDESTVRVEY